MANHGPKSALKSLHAVEAEAACALAMPIMAAEIVTTRAVTSRSDTHGLVLIFPHLRSGFPASTRDSWVRALPCVTNTLGSYDERGAGRSQAASTAVAWSAARPEVTGAAGPGPARCRLECSR